MRVKSPRLRRHAKVLSATKGYRMSKHRLYKVAHEASIHAGQYAYVGRRKRKRDLRQLWIIRINAAVRPLGLTYGKFIAALKKSNILLDRKILSDLAVSDTNAIQEIVKKINQ